MSDHWCGRLFLALLAVVGCASDEFSLDRGLRFSRPPLEGHAGGRVAIDARRYDPRNVRDSGLRLDQAEVHLDGSIGEHYDFRFFGDLLGIDSRFGFKEAWVSRKLAERVRVTAGLVPIAIGIESSFEEARMPFVGFAFPAHLDRRTDVGVEIEGEVAEGLFSWAVSGGAGEGFDLNGERRGDPSLAARLVTYPLRATTRTRRLSGIFFAAGASWGPSYEGQLDVAHPMRNKIFQTGRLDGGETLFWNIGYGVDAGPVRFTHEWVRGGMRDLDTPAGGEVNMDDQITAWAASIAWTITGELYDSRPYRQREVRAEEFPARPLFEVTDGVELERGPGWGALELALRYSNADIDRRFFDLGFTNFTISSQEFRTFTAALNWYATGNLRLTGEIVRTIADQFPAVFDSHGRDTSYLLRLQWVF